jgi:hypothetical protein
MKALKMVLIACSLSAAAAVAHAQTSDPAAGAQQLAQNQAQFQEQLHEQPATSASATCSSAARKSHQLLLICSAMHTL